MRSRRFRTYEREDFRMRNGGMGETMVLTLVGLGLATGSLSKHRFEMKNQLKRLLYLYIYIIPQLKLQSNVNLM